MVRYTVVSTTKEIKELTAGDVSLVIAWLVAAPIRKAPEKPIILHTWNSCKWWLGAGILGRVCKD
jgi:hypothetical protein